MKVILELIKVLLKLLIMFFQILWEVLSGEVIFRLFPNKSNDGFIIAIRALWISLLSYLAILGLKSITEPGSIFSLNTKHLIVLFGEQIAWFGAIYAGCYTALYSRFASQFSSLSETFNAITEKIIDLKIEEDNWRIQFILENKRHEGINNFIINSGSRKSLLQWKASFIEDADIFHLISKKIFYPAIKEFLTDEDVVNLYLDSTYNGKKRLKSLTKIYPIDNKFLDN